MKSLEFLFLFFCFIPIHFWLMFYAHLLVRKNIYSLPFKHPARKNEKEKNVGKFFDAKMVARRAEAIYRLAYCAK